MGKINYQKIYTTNKDEWKALTREPQKYEALLAGHYSESNHFVYELLQNAEDEKADRVVIEYYDDKLVFYHNGIPFDENDVRGVSSMLMGTKDRNSAQTIGRFGMGFKSVFKYTYQPEIYSDEEAFRIENYLLPVEIQNGWDYRRVMKELEYGLSSGGKYYPFSEQKHLTKIVIPFAKRKNDGTVIPVSGKEVLQKLQELNGEILLFLNHIKKLFWINQTNGKYAMITLDVDSTDCNLNSCRIEGSAYQQKEEITRYLKFKKTFDHPEMKDAEVSVAYKVNNKANVVYELKGEPVWVYFPTRDMTKLPFLIHGSFETAVSREKLMTPSEFNSALFQLLGDLIADSMKELKKRKLITQNFIRKVLIAAFKDETDNNTIPGLRNKITECLKKGSLIPDKDGNYYSVDELVIPVPFGIADFFDSKLFQTTFEDVGHFVAYNNEREANFNEYLAWMVDEVGVQTFTLVDWAKRMGNLKGICVPTKSAEYEKLEDFYDFLSDNRESIYTTGLRYSRSGRYEQTIRNNVSTAWKILKTSPIILNAQEELTAPYQGETEKLYLSATSDYQQMVLSSIVHKNVSAKFGQLLKDGFTLTDFDNFQYVKEKILKKYIKGETINFDNSENYEDEYIESFYDSIVQYVDGNFVSKWNQIDARLQGGEVDYHRFQNVDGEVDALKKKIDDRKQKISQIDARGNSNEEFELQNKLRTEKISLIMLQSYCQGNTKDLELMLDKEGIIKIWNVIQPILKSLQNTGLWLTHVGVDVDDLDSAVRINRTNDNLKYIITGARNDITLLDRLKVSSDFGGDTKELEELKIQETLLTEEMMNNPTTEVLEKWRNVKKKIADFNSTGVGLTDAELKQFDMDVLSTMSDDQKRKYIEDVLEKALPFINTLFHRLEEVVQELLKSISDQQVAFEEDRQSQELLFPGRRICL